MSTFQTVMLVFAILGIISVGIFLYIRAQYRNFCQREDQKERISLLRKKIASARTYIQTNYNTPFDTSIHDNIVPKMEFIEKLIMNKAPDDQERELQFLLDMLTETFVRLRDNYNDISLIVSPLNTLRDRLVQEHLQYIREHMDEDSQI